MMGRRKILIYGRSLDAKYEKALGFSDYEESGEVFSDLDFEVPKIDWVKISNRLQREVPEYSKQEIGFVFDCELGAMVRRAITGVVSGQIAKDELAEGDFFKKVARIENLAQKLTEEINELSEIGSQLLVSPKILDGLTSVEKPDEFYRRVSGRALPASEECFFDYYSFRKMLSYYANFSTKNGDFESMRDFRFGRTLDYTWYESFVRRVVLALWPTDFPMTVTIPTDTNPDFHSPIVLILEELRDQLNKIAISFPVFSGVYEEWSYRQHARLVLKLRKEFDKNDIFWTLNSLRLWENEQSEFDEMNI